MGLIPSSYRNKYILVAVNYVSKWVEAISSPTNDAKVVLNLFKTIIFPRFWVPRVVISDRGKHFINKVFENLLKKHGVKHKVAAPYHPQTSEQVEIANREIKSILKIGLRSSMTRYGLIEQLSRPLSAQLLSTFSMENLVTYLLKQVKMNCEPLFVTIA